MEQETKTSREAESSMKSRDYSLRLKSMPGCNLYGQVFALDFYKAYVSSFSAIMLLTCFCALDLCTTVTSRYQRVPTQSEANCSSSCCISAPRWQSNQDHNGSSVMHPSGNKVQSIVQSWKEFNLLCHQSTEYWWSPLWSPFNFNNQTFSYNATMKSALRE